MIARGMLVALLASVAGIAGCSGADRAGPAAGWLEAILVERSYDRFEEFFAENARINGSSFGEVYLSGTADGLHAAFPDLSLDVLERIAADDRVVIRFELHGTHEGPFNTFPATHRQVRFAGIVIDHLSEGRVTDSWLQLDLWSMAQQIGTRTPVAGEP